MFSNQILVFTCVVIAAVHVGLAWLTGNWVLVSRSGAAIVALCILIQSWKILLTRRAADLPFWKSQENHNNLRTTVVIIAVGTLLQGYGDCIGYLVPGLQ